MNDAKSLNWKGYIIVIPEQHNLVITGTWKKERPDMWWWKCRDCTESSGVMSTKQLEALKKKGMIDFPDGKIPTEYSSHPKETSISPYDEDCYFAM